MSAIWGKHIFSNKDIDTITDNTMREPYEQRCRIDKINTLTNNNTYMGCGLQYITETASREQLPFLDTEHNILFTCDCILDNRNELIAQLSADSDTPDGMLIYKAYLKWGIDCLKKLRGLFSFALYDSIINTLYLATDQTSSRCLYYYIDNDEVYFSTLLSPILNSCPKIRHNKSYLLDYCFAPGLMPSITATETPYENVYKVTPGSYIQITNNHIQEHTYWNPALDTFQYKLSSAEQYGKAFRTLFEECITSATRTVKNTGISLSSGLDSSSIGAIAATQFRKKNKTLLSYTYIPYEKNVTDPHKNFVLDETNDINKILSLHPNIEPHFLNNNGRNCLEDIKKCISIMEIPFKAIINLPNLCEIYESAYHDGCGIVLTGQCGNSTISYGNIEDILYDHYINHRYFSLVSNILKYAKRSGISRKNSLKGCFKYYKGVQKKYNDTTFCYKPTNSFVTDIHPNEYQLEERFTNNLIINNEQLPIAQELYQQHLYNKAMYSYLGELDTKMGLAHGIVIRDPSRDCRIISFCHNIPYSHFAHDGLPRWLIRGNFADILPKSLLYNLSRYGLQNADWLLRIDRDWDKLYPQITRAFEEIADYLPINIEHINNYFINCHDTPTNVSEFENQYLLFIYNLLLFIKGDYQ